MPFAPPAVKEERIFGSNPHFSEDTLKLLDLGNTHLGLRFGSER